jgi:serine/threonine protein kinase
VPPRTVASYEILSVVGRGGIGTVYRARHRDTGRPVALKVLAPPPACDPTAARRLAREFEALQALEHPNVVRVFEAGVHEGYSFLAMELVEGLDLRSYLSPLIDEAAGGPPPAAAVAAPHPFDLWSDEPDTETLVTPEEDHGDDGGYGAEAIRAFAALMDEPETDPRPQPAQGDPGPSDPASGPAEARPLAPALAECLNRGTRIERLRDALLQVCNGLSYVHAHGLVHRDLKPSNIMVDDARRVRLMDFGLVKLTGDAIHLTQHGKVVGTYRYMAPEQARGEPVDLRADLYSLGVILFELLCGRPPFTARRPAELWNQIIARPPPDVRLVNPGADERLARIAGRLLAKDRHERYQRAEEIAAELRV